MEKLKEDFFEKNAKEVARKILGKIVVRKIGERELRAKVVEAEAYFGEDDPASKASKGNGDLKKTMSMRAGIILVYGIHNNWLVNFVTGKKGKPEAILIRALEPLNFEARCNGPGLLTKALEIGKDFHKKNIYESGELFFEDSDENFEIMEDFRIGVSKDLPEKLRFYIKGNKHVSRQGTPLCKTPKIKNENRNL